MGEIQAVNQIDDGQIHFRCPHCDKRIAVPMFDAGKVGRCKRCHKQVRVPAESASIPESQNNAREPIIKCPACGAKLALIERHRLKPMLRCRRCRNEFANELVKNAGSEPADDSLSGSGPAEPDAASSGSGSDVLTLTMPIEEEDKPATTYRPTIKPDVVDEWKKVFGKQTPQNEEAES